MAGRIKILVVSSIILLLVLTLLRAIPVTPSTAIKASVPEAKGTPSLPWCDEVAITPSVATTTPSLVDPLEQQPQCRLRGVARGHSHEPLSRG